MFIICETEQHVDGAQVLFNQKVSSFVYLYQQERKRRKKKKKPKSKALQDVERATGTTFTRAQSPIQNDQINRYFFYQFVCLRLIAQEGSIG